MRGTARYGQYCPIAIAAEVMAERWTPLVLRGLFCGATRFNDIQASVPRMSSSLLSRRLKELEYANIIERKPSAGGRGGEYRLTEAGHELFPVLDAMGVWAQKWLRREITRDENLDPDVLMWEVRRMAINAGDAADDRVVEFRLDGVPTDRRRYWLVFEAGDIDICVQDPGHEVDLWVEVHMRTLVEIWLGFDTLAAAGREGRLRLEGSRAERDAFKRWFHLSHFAPSGQELTRREAGHLIGAG